MIHARDVWKRVSAADVTVEILRGVTLDIARGEMVGLLGPSGAGKTTLLNLIAGVDHPSSGEIIVNGQRLAGLDRRRLALFRRETVGMVFQSFHLLPNLTALENAALPMHLRGMPPKAVRDRARECLEWVGLAARAQHLPEQLSGGERQRIAMARAISGNPPLLLADEPTGNLDSETGRQTLELLTGLHARLGTTLLIVTHDPAVAASCHRILELRDGRLVADLAT